MELSGIQEYRWVYQDDKVGEIWFSKTGEAKTMNTWFPCTWVGLTFDPENNLSSTSAGDLGSGGALESYIWLENINGQRSKKILCDWAI